MPLSGFLKELRKKIGHDLLILPSSAVAVHDGAGGILMGLHSDRQIWVVPGGLIEPGETPAEAAVREAWEETGLFIELTDVLAVYGGKEFFVDYPNGDRAAYIGTIFRARVIGGEMKPDGEEILELKYVTRAELQNLPHPQWMDMAMDVLYSAGGGPAHFQKSDWRP